MSWRQLWGTQSPENPKSPMPSQDMDSDCMVGLCPEGAREAWQYVTDTKARVVVCGAIIAAITGLLLLLFGVQSMTDMVDGLITFGSGLLATSAVLGAVFLYQCFYAIPKRRLQAKNATIEELNQKVRELEQKLADLAEANEKPQLIVTALRELKKLAQEADSKLTLFQLIDLLDEEDQVDIPPPPAFVDAQRWDVRATEHIARNVFSGYLDSDDLALHREPWPNDALTVAVQNLQRYSRLTDPQHIMTYRYFWGRLQRLKEVIARIEAGPKNSRSRIQFEQRKPEREECARQAAKLLKKDNMQVFWSMNALFRAGAHKLQHNDDVVWVCNELMRNNHVHPFQGIEYHVPKSDYLRFLNQALIHFEVTETERSGDYLILADRWPEMNGYPPPSEPISPVLWAKRKTLKDQEG